MPYKMNRLVDREEYARHHIDVLKYMEELRQRGLLIEMGNIFVDADQLVLRRFICDTNYCVKCKTKDRSREYVGSCCTDLQVDVTPFEKQKLLELARMAARKIEMGDGGDMRGIVDMILNDKYAEKNDEGGESLRHRKNERCILSWMDENGQLRCSINTMCQQTGAPLHEFKPDPCFLFPLHYAQVGTEDYLLTMLSEETRHWVGQDKAVTRLKCLKSPQDGAPPAYKFLKYELEYLLGAKFFRDLDGHAERLLARYFGSNGNGAAIGSAARAAGAGA